jgi:hypothetical protein
MIWWCADSSSFCLSSGALAMVCPHWLVTLFIRPFVSTLRIASKYMLSSYVSAKLAYGEQAFVSLSC